MFDLINGLPIHPLVVHAVVVLLPLAVLGTIAIAVRPAWRARYGVIVTAVALLAVLFIPVATSSGESLQARVGDPGQHAELGDQLIWFAIPLLACAAALTWFGRLTQQATDATSRKAAPGKGPTMTVAVVAVVVALATTVQVYRVGDSGARAAWGDQVASSSSATQSHGDSDD
ncbi:DUF2231 domain-containing protein [Xylanimonas sp. McL0601]|uniref:DUF2231 domain-containing protein n=1 Tax=Xylanimonas sp. McL0601 TaxID=3414739 RepID=UPI003CF82405